MKEIIFALIALLFWGLAPIFGKIGLADTSPFLGLSVRTFGIAIILLFLGIGTGEISKIVSIDLNSILFLLGEGIFAGLLGHIAYFYSLEFGKVSRVVPIVMAFPLVSVIIGILFLNESIGLLKAVGVPITVCGIILLSL